MCTLTWSLRADGYDLLFNRDERRTRQIEVAAQLVEIRGEPVIMPRDGDHEGTWLAVNQAGVSYALLNHYDAERALPSPEKPMSRGMIPIEMALEDHDDLGWLDLPRFRPFHLLRLGPNASYPSVSWVWDGEALERSSPDDWELPFLTTSSFDSGRAVGLRREAFRSLGPSPGLEGRRQFHRSSSAEGSAYGVLMRRPDAMTMSITEIRVQSERIDVCYVPTRDASGGEEEGEAVESTLRRSS